MELAATNKWKLFKVNNPALATTALNYVMKKTLCGSILEKKARQTDEWPHILQSGLFQ